MKKLFYAAIICTAAYLQSCVPARQVEEIKANYEKCNEERNSLLTERKNLETENTELKAKLEDLTKQITALKTDTTVLGTSLRTMKIQYDKINKLNDELLKKQAELQRGSELENRKLMMELQALQADLQKKEDDLNKLEQLLDAKKRDLDALSAELKKTEAELQKREQRVNELEDLLAKKDQAVLNMKKQIADALLGYENQGLTVEHKNGKIYVKMEAKLLFAKGSTKVDPKGKKALVDLAKVLADQKDIEIMVEGHTDSDKLSGSGCLKDNWDLSVMRATSVVKIMLENSSIDPSKIIAAGRSEFVPVAPNDTEANKSKNRRIEVIVTPNLEKIFELLESGQTTNE
jgi:chemotaxis protein MotB